MIRAKVQITPSICHFDQRKSSTYVQQIDSSSSKKNKPADKTLPLPKKRAKLLTLQHRLSALSPLMHKAATLTSAMNHSIVLN